MNIKRRNALIVSDLGSGSGWWKTIRRELFMDEKIASKFSGGEVLVAIGRGWELSNKMVRGQCGEYVV